MTDPQLLTVVLTLVAILGSIIANRKSVEDMRDVLRAEAKAGTAELRIDLQRIENKIDHLSETVALHGTRLEALEKKIP